MAVGYTDMGAENDALAYQFDGTSWSLVTVPDPPAGVHLTGLSEVSCASASFCVAMGAGVSHKHASLVAETWNGMAWRSTPIDEPGFVAFTALDCPKPRGCVAVGNRTVHDPLSHAVSWVLRAGTFHLVTPARPSTNNDLSGISCLSPSNCTAVGLKQKYSEPLIEHWDGTAWQEVREPAAPRGVRYDGAWLTDVTCVRVGTCLAVGSAGYGGSGAALLASRIDGGPWRASTVQVTRGDGAADNGLGRISCLTVSVCAVIGSYLSNECCRTAIIAWQDRSTHHLVVDWPQRAIFGDVSCIAKRCIYVGQKYIDLAINPNPDDPWNGPPVIYQGTRLHPVRQTIPLPTH